MNIKKLLPLTTVLITVSLFINVSTFGQTQNLKETVSYTKFIVTARENKILIDWSVNNPLFANYFEIQKSFDEKNFKTIAMVLGPDPKDISGNKFSCFDTLDFKVMKHSYYRLKHIDINGFVEMSEIKTIEKI